VDGGREQELRLISGVRTIYTTYYIIKGRLSTSNIHRVSTSLPKNELLAVIQKFEYQGLSLIIEGWHKKPSWSTNVLNPDWLANKYTEGMRHGIVDDAISDH
jgi:hypothetical protein